MTTPTDTLLRKDEREAIAHLQKNESSLVAAGGQLLRARLTEARTKLAEREAQLRRHGGHGKFCHIHLSFLGTGKRLPCDCGWSAVEAGLPRGRTT